MFRTLLLVLSLCISPAFADPFKIVVPSENDSYNLNARILGKYIVKYLPEKPTLAIQVVPGASSLVAANYLYNLAPRDGTVIGTLKKDIALVGVLGGDNIKFDPLKFSWIGSNLDGRKDAIIVWTNSDRPHIFGSENYPGINLTYLVKDLARLDSKVVVGYADTGTARLALERKEVDGEIYNLSGIKLQKPNWLDKDSEIKAWLQFGNGPNRHPEYKDVQTLYDMLQSEDQKEILSTVEASLSILRPFLAPPDVPYDRLKILREAFNNAVKDPEYLEEARNLKLDVSLMDYNEVENLVGKQTNISPTMIERLKKYDETKQ